MKKKKVFSIVPKKYKAKYSIGEKVSSSGIYECSVCSDYTAFKRGETFSRCQDCINENREEINRWFVTNEVVHFMSKILNIEFEKISTFGIRLSDWVAEFVGSWTFIVLFLGFMVLWMAFNVYAWIHVWDPYPFILLNLFLSTVAAIQAPLILMSQNRQEQRNELRADLDYQVNLSTEKEVAELVAMVKEIKDEYMLSKKTESEMVKKRRPAKRERVGNRSLEEIEKEEMEEEERLLKEAGIYMIEPPDDEESD